MSELNITLVQEYDEDLSGVDGDGLGEGEVAFEGEEWCWEDREVCLQSLLQPFCELAKNREQKRDMAGRRKVRHSPARESSANTGTTEP